jgi:hypothetical protein
MMEEFELFGIDPTERANALTPEEFAELQQLLAEEAVLQTESPQLAPQPAIDLGAGEGFQGKGFTRDPAQFHRPNRQVINAPYASAMVPDPSWGQEAIPLNLQDVVASPADVAPMSFNPGAYPQAYGAEPQGLSPDFYNQQTTPIINTNPDEEYMRLHTPTEELSPLAQGPDAPAQIAMKREMAIKMGMDPNLVGGWNLGGIGIRNLENWIITSQNARAAGETLNPGHFLRGPKGQLETSGVMGISQLDAEAAAMKDGGIQAAQDVIGETVEKRMSPDVYAAAMEEQAAGIQEQGVKTLIGNGPRARRLRDELGVLTKEVPQVKDYAGDRYQEFLGATKHLLMDPIRLSQIVVESAASMPDALVGGIMAAPAGMTMAAISSMVGAYNSEYSRRLVDGLQEVGIDLTKVETVNELRDSPQDFYDRFSRANKDAAGDAMIIAFFSGLGVKLAAGIGAKIAGRAAPGASVTPRTFAGATAGELATAPLEAVGEGLAGGSITEMVDEMFGGLGASAPTTVYAAAQAARNAGMSDAGIKKMILMEAKKHGFDAERVDTELDAGPQVEAQYDRSDATVAFNVDSIRRYAASGGRKDVKARIKQLIRHEVGVHGGLIAWFKTGKGSKALGGIIDGMDAYIDSFDNANKAKIDDWLTNNERGKVYAEDLDGNRRKQVEEYIAIQIAEGLGSGPIRNVLSKMRLLFKKAADVDFSEGELRDILRQIQSDQISGRLAPTPTGTIAPTTPEGARRAVLNRGAENVDVDTLLSKQSSDRELTDYQKQRRGILKAGAAVAAAPSLAFEPDHMIEAAAEPTSTFAGGIFPPGLGANQAEFLREGALEAASGLVSDTAGRAIPEEAYDFEADQEIARQEEADLKARLDKYEADQEEKKVPQKWRELDTEDLQTLAEANRAKDNPIWQAQYKELESRKETSPPDLEAGSMEAYQQAVAERQAAQDKMDKLTGDIDDAVMDTARSTDPTPKLVDQRVAEDTLFSKQAKDMNDQEKLGRDVGYDVSRFGYKQIVGRPDEVEIRGRLKRVQSLWGKPGQIREANPGTREFANELIDKAKNDRSGFEEAMAAFEDVMATKAQSRTLRGQQTARAKRLGVDIDAFKQYRARNEIHPVEKKMTYTMAQQQIDALENDGTIDSKEAENRRRAVNTLNSELEGRLPPLAKRKLAGITYGTGTKFNIDQTQKMDLEKEAEIAKAEERLKRTRRVAPTSEQAATTTSALPTPAETTLIEAMRESDSYKELKTDKQRLRWIREKESMSDKDRRQFDAFSKDPENWNQAEFEAAEAAGIEAAIAEVGVTRIEQTPEQKSAELREMQRARQSYKEQRKIFQVEGGYYDTLAEGEMLSEQDEILPEGFEIDEGATLQSKRPLKVSDAKVGTNIMVRFRGNNWSRAEITEVNEGKTPHIVYELPLTGTEKTHRTGRVNIDEIPDKVREGLDKNAIDRAEAERRTRNVYGPDKLKREVKNVVTRVNSVLENKTVEADHVVELLNIAIDPQSLEEVIDTGRLQDRGKNLAVVGIRLHKIKSDWTRNREWSEGFQETQDRQDNPSPYTAMLDWIRNSGDRAKVAKFLKAHPELGRNGIRLAVFKAQMRLAKANGTLIESLVDGINTFEPGKIDLTPAQRAGLQAIDADMANTEVADALGNQYLMMSKRPKAPKGSKGYSEHFNDHFWYRLTSFLWGKPVQAIRDFNKLSRFGQAKGSVPAADQIADEIQRAHSSTQRADELVYGTDMMQDTSLKSGEFYSELAQLFALMTGRTGAINTRNNKTLVDVLIGKIRVQELTDKKTRDAAEGLQALVQKVYNYAKSETKHLAKPLDLRGHGDTLLPRVWNIEFLATRAGKAKFLRVIRNELTNPETGSNILDETDLSIDDLYDVVINSGGFVQGDWTNLKADQTRSQKDIDRDLRAQEYLDSLETENLLDDGLVLDDLQAIIPRFIQKAIERTEYSKRFGINDELLRDKIKEALAQIGKHNASVLKLNPSKEQAGYIDPKRFEKSVWDMARILRNKYGYDITNMNTRTWLQRLANVQVIAKLPLVTLASMPELFTPMLRGSVNPAAWSVDLMAGMAWAGYKAMNGISKLMFNTHLPAMRKVSGEIGGLGIIRDVQMLREMGIAEIQAMGDLVSTRYANPNFARGGLRAGARGTISAKIPKQVRSVFNMQVFMQATLLTTLTEMQQLMAMRNFQRHMVRRVKFVNKNKDKALKGRKLRLFNQFKQDMADFGMDMDVNLDTSKGEAEFNAGALRFIDQVITRPNDATTAKAFKNPLTAPIFLFKRFITTFGNTLMTAVGNDMANKVNNVEQAKQAGKILVAMTTMYGAVMFAEIIRGAIKGDLDEDDATITGGDFKSFVRRLDRTGLLSAPGAMAVNLAFPYKRGWWDTPEARLVGELGGPILGDLTEILGQATDPKVDSFGRLVRQVMPLSKKVIPPNYKKKSTSKTNKNKPSYSFSGSKSSGGYKF